MDEELDASLRRALAARPEPELPADLAARAVRRASLSSRTLYRPAAFWRTVSSLAACLLIVGLLSFGAWRWYRSSSSSSDTSQTYATDTSTTSLSAADTTSSQNAALLLVAGAVLVLSLGLVTLDRMLSGDDAAGASVFV
jgi:hypothetical protein